MLAGYALAALSPLLTVLMIASAAAAVVIAYPAIRTPPDWTRVKLAFLCLLAPWALILLLTGFGGVLAYLSFALDGRPALASPLTAVGLGVAVAVRAFR